MCIETIEVSNVSDTREAYEISEYLKGVPHIDDARCDFLSDTIVIDYDETELTREDVLDEVEYGGCRPRERRPNTMLGRLRESVGV